MCVKNRGFSAGDVVRVCERDEVIRLMGSFVTIHVEYCVLVCVRLGLGGNMQVGDPLELGGVGFGVDVGRDVGVANEEVGGPGGSVGLGAGTRMVMPITLPYGWCQVSFSSGKDHVVALRMRMLTWD